MPDPALAPDRPASVAADPDMRAAAVPAPPGPPPNTGLYPALWHYAAGARVRLALSAVLLFGSQLVKLAVPWFAAQAINALQLGGASAARTAAGWVALVVASSIAAWVLHGPGRIVERAVGIHIRRAHADALYAKAMRAPLGWHERRHSADVQQRMAQSVGALYAFAQSQFVYVQIVVTLLGPLFALTLFAPTLGAIAIAGYVVVALTIVRFDRVLMRLAIDENRAERRYQAGVVDFLSNVATLMALRLQPHTRRLLGSRMAAIFVPLRRNIRWTEAKWCTVDLFGLALTWGLVALYVGLQLAGPAAAGGTIMIGSVFMVYQYATQASGVVGTIAGTLQGYAHTRTDFAAAEPIWAAPEREAPGTPIAPGWSRIEIRELFHAHAPADGVRAHGAGAAVHGAAEPAASGPDATRPPAALHDIALTLARGERIALVGASGAGKSTLLRVLAGLHMPYRCSVAVDGVAQPGARHLGSIATLIPQEADVFEATVRENIAFDGTTDDDALCAVLHASAFDDVLEGLPQGLATPISERGFNLSGGQRQRLCLARGLLAARDSSLVLLDEPTSALDPVTEERVFDRIASAFAGACIVASVQRMSLLSHFDRVVLMADGRVVDAGTLAQLLERQPMLRQMTGRQPLRTPALELVGTPARRARS